MQPSDEPSWTGYAQTRSQDVEQFCNRNHVTSALFSIVASSASPGPMTVTILEEISVGSGGKLPVCGDKVVCHYAGYLAMRPDAPPFDSSREKGHAFSFAVGVNKVIQGWDDAVMAMSKGTRRKVLITSDDAYGPKGRPPVIPANADLIFDIELLDINETLVEEGMRVRREEAERVEKFLKLQDEARSAEARTGSSSAAPGPKRERASSSSGSDSYSDSDSEDSEQRRRREKKERKRKREKREKKERKKERKKEHKHRHKDGKERNERKEKKEKKKDKKRRRDSD